MYKKKQDEMSPRISFSNDLAESSHKKKAASYREAPVSSDFEFCVNDHSMMSADELFSKGTILPFKGKTSTLRDELRNEDDGFSSKPPKTPARLRGFFGLRRTHLGSKKSTQSSKSLQDCDE